MFGVNSVFSYETREVITLGQHSGIAEKQKLKLEKFATVFST